jgi:hypothetical protein
VTGLVLDLRHALRSLGRSPGFALTAVVTLGLGIGATVTVASFVVAVFFRPLAVPQGRRLVRIEAVDAKGLPHPVGVPAARLLEARTRVFDRVASQYSRSASSRASAASSPRTRTRCRTATPSRS